MKRVMNIEELNAIHMSYEKKLTRKDVGKIACLPALYVPIFVFLIFFKWWLIPIGFIVGILYGVGYMLPLVIKSQYQKRSLKERNRFINNLAQSLHRKNVTILDALSEVSAHRMHGELKNDVGVLAYSVATHSSKHRKQAYQLLIDKYEHDRIFVQFIEHLITVDLNGLDNLTPLDETAEAHDNALAWQEHYMECKKQSLLYFLTNNLLAFGLSISVIWLTWDNHLEWFTKSLVGWGFGSLYIIMTLFYNHRFIKDYYDEHIMEVKHS